jgi:alkylglycerol monooxygenase
MSNQQPRGTRDSAEPAWRDNLCIGACRAIFEFATRGSQLGLYTLVGTLSPVDAALASNPWIWVWALVGYDFLYYVAHRSHHRWGFLWAIHAVHHQPTQMNLSVGLRAGMLNAVVHLPFFLPLALLGCPSKVFLGVSMIHLAAMAWLHTDKIKPIGWLEGIINTPSLHRVHHSSDPRDHDHNFGGILIIYDRLFGTYAPPRERVTRYGIHGQEAVFGVVPSHLAPLRAWWETKTSKRKDRYAAG